MRDMRGQPILRFRGIDDVIRELESVLRSRNKRIEDDPQLLRVIEEISLNHGLKIDPDKLIDVAKIIADLNHLKLTTEEDVLNDEIAESGTTSEEDLENARVPTAKIKELVEEYERHLDEGLTHQQALERVSKNNKGLVARKNVATFLERQQAIYQETVQKLESEAKLGKEEAKRMAEAVATERLLVEEKLVAVEVNRALAEKIARETVGKTARGEVLIEATQEITDETTRQYAEEVVTQGIETVNSKVVVDKKVDAIAEKLIEDLRSIDPDEVTRNEPELTRVIKEKVVEQIRGEARLEDASVSKQEANDKQQQGFKKLSEEIVELLGLPPSKSAVVEKAIGETNIQATEWDKSKTEAAVNIIVDELEKTSDVKAVAKVKEDEVRRVATEEIEAAISEGRSFGQVTEKVAGVLDPDLNKKVAVELAVEKAELETKKWSEAKIQRVADELVDELGPKAAVKKEAVKLAVAEQVRPVAGKRVDFSGLSNKIAIILETSEGETLPISKAVASAENKGREWDSARTDKTIDRLVSVLREDNIIAAKLSSTEVQFKAAIRPKVEGVIAGESAFEESTYETPPTKNLTERIAGVLNVSQEKIPQVNLAIKNAGLLTDQMIFSDKDNIKIIRAEHIRNETEKGFLAVNGRLTAEQVISVHNYSRLVGDFYSDVNLDVYKKDAVAFAENRGNRPGVLKNAWNDVTGISKLVQMPTKKFKAFQQGYYQIRGGLRGLNMPFRVPGVRSLDGLMRMTKEIPQVRNLLAFAQKFTNLYSSVNNFTGGFLQRIGLEKFGTAIIQKVGGQAMGAFVQNSLAVVAEHGAQKGLLMILNGVLSGGVQAGAAGAAGGAAAGAAGAGATGALSGAVAAFQAIPVVGQVILVAALVVGVALTAYNKIIKPILSKVKNFINSFASALGIDVSAFQIGTKKFLQENFGKFAGGLMDFGLKVGMFVVGIPAILAGIKIATSPIAWVFIALLGMGLMTSLNVSAQVPRGPPAGVEVYDYGDDPGDPFVPGLPLPTRDPRIVIPAGCPGIWPTGSGVVTQGPLGTWSHRTTQAIDIGVGSVPIMATHNGLAIPGGNRNDPYGYYVDVVGVCNGIPIATRYAHMPILLFTTQKLVGQGEIIGYVDNTGNSTGSHLHYELTGGQINDWLPKPVPLRCSEVYECKVSIP